MLTDGVQVGALVLPEVELSERIGVDSLLEGLLGVFPQLGLDLLSPVAESVLQNGGLVFRRSLLLNLKIRFLYYFSFIIYQFFIYILFGISTAF